MSYNNNVRFPPGFGYLRQEEEGAHGHHLEHDVPTVWVVLAIRGEDLLCVLRSLVHAQRHLQLHDQALILAPHDHSCLSPSHAQ